MAFTNYGHFKAEVSFRKMYTCIDDTHTETLSDRIDTHHYYCTIIK